MIKKKEEELNKINFKDLNNICEECKKEDKSVSHNIILILQIKIIFIEHESFV